MSWFKPEASGGHRMAAIDHIEEALKEIQKGEAYAREHHEIK